MADNGGEQPHSEAYDDPAPSDTAEHSATSIFPPVGDAPEDASTQGAQPEAEAGAVAEQFPALDPELVTQSIEAIAPSAVLTVETRRSRAAALWQGWLRSRFPLLVVALVLAVVSLPRTVSAVVNVTTAYPVVGVASLVLWLLYAFPLIWLITRVDFFEREPNTLIGMALAWGGVVATSMAVSANQALFSLLTSARGEAFTARWGSALVAPTTEEALKTLGIIAVVLLATRGIRSAIDGFIVGAVVGLGFQVVENFVYTGNLLLATGQEHPIRTALNVFIVRGLGSGLWSHAVYSGVAGLGIGYAFTRLDRSRGRRIVVAAAMFALAWFLHFVWNLPVLVDGLSALGAVIKAAIILGLLALVLYRNQGRESYIYTDYLETVHDRALITPAEIEDLRTYRSREAAARAAARTGGARAAEAVRRLQRRQADLSVAMANGDLEQIANARRGIAAARAGVSASVLLPDEVGHNWGVAAIWVSIVGVLVPIIGPLIAAGLAAIGTRQAQRAGATLAPTVRAAWVLSAVSFVVGLLLIVLLMR